MSRIVNDLAESLINVGYQVDYVVHEAVTTCFHQPHPSIHVYSLELNGCIHEAKRLAAKRLRKLIKQGCYDYLICSGVFLTYITCLAFTQLLGCKVILWEHFTKNGVGFIRSLKHYFGVAVSNKTVVLTSHELKEYPFILRHKMVVIPNWSKINKENRIADLKNKTVLAVGRYDYLKGFDLLIKAWKLVHNVHPDWKLRLVGDGCEKFQIQIDEEGLSSCIETLGRTSHINEEYQHCSIYCLSSRKESFGLVIIEAKSFGIPCVAFDCPYGPREVINNGIDGLLVENGNCTELANNLIHLMNHQEEIKKMGYMAKMDYQKRFTPNESIQKWIEILR